MPATPTPTPVPQPFPIIAYAMESVVVEVIPFERLTHFNYAFLIPNADGGFQPLNNPWKLKRIVELAHAQDVKVLIAVGGWGWDTQFEAMAANPENRSAFVSELVAFVDEYGLDGADIDWEYPDPGQSAQNFLTLMHELRQALPDKLLSTAVVALGSVGQGIPQETFTLVDFVNIMAYDGSGPSHSSMKYAQDALDYWLGRGLPSDKAVLGVPFYARPDGTPYHRIVKADLQAASQDTFDMYGIKLNYNGIPTIQEKTRLAMQRAGGIMFWALDHDSLDDTSLLLAIYNTVHGGEP